MRFDILTLFPEMFSGPIDLSIVKRAREQGRVDIHLHNIRDWSTDNYKSVDDHPYGGGPGMILRVDVIDKAIRSIKGQLPNLASYKTVLLDARGNTYTQSKAFEYSKLDGLLLICGHYEGVDHRVHEHLVDEVLSIGNYVLSGGELPAMLIVDSVARLLPGVLGNSDSLTNESHNTNEVEYPQYTRPHEYNNWKVPEILLGGNHSLIDSWRKEKSAKR